MSLLVYRFARHALISINGACGHLLDRLLAGFLFRLDFRGTRYRYELNDDAQFQGQSSAGATTVRRLLRFMRVVLTGVLAYMGGGQVPTIIVRPIRAVIGYLCCDLHAGVATAGSCGGRGVTVLTRRDYDLVRFYGHEDDCLVQRIRPAGGVVTNAVANIGHYGDLTYLIDGDICLIRAGGQDRLHCVRWGVFFRVPFVGGWCWAGCVG